MSSMLEQAIVDAQALREAALKNAEQALIEKFAPQIKEAVESLLEGEHAPSKRKVSYEGKNYSLHELEDGKATIMREGEKPFVVSESELGEELVEELLQEEEGEVNEESFDNSVEAPYSFMPGDEEASVKYSMKYQDPVYDFDLGDLMMEEEPVEEPEMDLGAAPEEEPAEDEEELDLGGLELQEEMEDEDEDELVQEIMNLMNEMYNDKEDNEELLEEELIVDVSEQKHGWITTDEATRKYDEDLRKARDAAEYNAEQKDKENKELKESIKHLKHKNLQYKDAVEKLSQKLNETLLSNAKLLYSNKTLGDASLNERQKNKIVEAIAKARTPEEAKNLCEALNATVTSGQDNKSPRTLSESVTRKSTLSGILPRKTQVNESPEHTFAEKMKKLAGIK